MSFDITQAAPVLKRMYSKSEPEDVAQRDTVAFQDIKKSDSYGGSGYAYAIKFANSQNVSTDFATSLGATGNNQTVQVLLTSAKKFGTAKIYEEAILACKDEGGFVDAITFEVDGMLTEMGIRTEIDMFGSGSSSIGRCSATVAIAGNVVTLRNASDAINFPPGAVISTGPNDSSTGIHPGTTTVVASDEDAGTVTFADVTQWTGFTSTSDFFFNTQDAGQGLSGFAAWFPLAAPALVSAGGTLFFGMDRGKAPSRLAGSRLDNTGGSIKENLKTLAIKILRASGNSMRPDVVYMSTTSWQNLSNSLGSQVLRDAGGTAVEGFESLKLAVPTGSVIVKTAAHCPDSRAYMLSKKTLELIYMGPGVPHIVKTDGNYSRASTTFPGIEVRSQMFAQVKCTAPVGNGVMSI